MGPDMTENSETELKPCPFCGGRMQPRHALWPSEGDSDGIIHTAPTECPAEGFSIGTADEGVSVAAAWNRRSPSRREVLEEAARVADKHYQDSKKSAAYYKSLPDDDGSYGQCLADMIVAGDIAIAIRALAGEK